MMRVDDTRIIGGILRIVAVKSPYPVSQTVKQLVPGGFVDKKVVRCDAGLSGIEKFSPDDPLCGKVDFRVRIDNAGAFSAEFKGQRGKVFRRGAGDEFCPGRAAGIENAVEFLCKQLLRHFVSAVADRGIFWRKHRRNDLCRDFRCCRSLFRRLENDAVACRTGADEWREQ